MPLYEIRHTSDLSSKQQETLAQGITKIHSTKFTTPKLFVNVLFTPFADRVYFAGGLPKRGNHIIANVRVGPSRTKQDWDDLSNEVVALWEEVIGKDGGKELHSLFLLGGMVGGYEAGFLIPSAGEDQQWMEKHWSSFEEKANGGNQDFVNLIAEVKDRGLLPGNANGHCSKESLM